ncbi:MAG TPA: DUF58 domain-containing protein [Armatimonadetes bacterium]|jgi:uncharacterized protein (DUF58 family)|nr:DUF58 domain-containing protein [Armatimonadota bacterium]
MGLYSIWPFLIALIVCVGLVAFVLRMRNPKITTLIVAPIFLYLVSAILGSAQLYFMGTMLLGICIVAFFFAHFSLRGITVERTATTPVARGDQVEVRVEVTNRDRLPKLFVRVRCPMPEWLRAEQETVAIAGLWPGQRSTVRVYARALKRGRYALPPVEVVGADPLDLFQRLARFRAPQEVVVHPTPEAAPSLELLGDDLLGTVAPRRVMRPGHGLDFHGLREYRPGDDVRAIDWKATARLSRLITIEFEPTQVGDLVILLDNREKLQIGTGPNSTLERAISLAAGAAAAVLEGRGSVHLRALGDGAATTVSAAAGDMRVLMDALAGIRAEEGSLQALVPEDVRGRTVLLVTPSAGPEVVATVRQATAGGGQAVALLLDRAAWTEERPASGIGRYFRRDAAADGDAESMAAMLHDAGARALVVGRNGLSREHAMRVWEEMAS